MIPVHAHAWQSGECRKCHAPRCADSNRAGFRCTRQQHHTEPHHYADGTTAAS